MGIYYNVYKLYMIICIINNYNIYISLHWNRQSSISWTNTHSRLGSFKKNKYNPTRPPLYEIPIGSWRLPVLSGRLVSRMRPTSWMGACDSCKPESTDILQLAGGFKYFFTNIWGRFPIWLIYFRWVETTNYSQVSGVRGEKWHNSPPYSLSHMESSNKSCSPLAQTHTSSLSISHITGIFT